MYLGSTVGGQGARARVILVLRDCSWNVPGVSLVLLAFDDTAPWVLFLYIQKHTNTSTRINTSTHTNTSARTNASAHSNTNTHTNTSTHTHTNPNIHTNISTNTNTHTHAF